MPESTLEVKLELVAVNIIEIEMKNAQLCCH